MLALREIHKFDKQVFNVNDLDIETPLLTCIQEVKLAEYHIKEVLGFIQDS
jgi:hypothetical protein